MLNCVLNRIGITTRANGGERFVSLFQAGAKALCAAAILAVAAGCNTMPPSDSSGSVATSTPGPIGTPPAMPAQAHTTPMRAAAPPAASAATPTAPEMTGGDSTNSSKSLILQEGDVIRVSFAGAPNLDATQVIRRDGKVTLGMIGEYYAAGKTPSEMEADLKKRYASELVNNEISVTVQSSAWVIYVMGAVGRPGKLVSERPLSPLEALIEAGIDDSRSNLKSIQIIRTDYSGHTEKFKLNLYKVLHNKDEQMPEFTLRPYDIIRVKERFSFY